MPVLLHILILILALCAVYLVLIMPRIIFVPDRTPVRGGLFAHRGLHDNSSDAPENSLLAFQRAVDRGFGIELDVQLSADGVPVIMHDFTLERACGVTGRVDERTLEELRGLRLFSSDQRIPTLAEVLEVAAGRVPLLVEFKVEKTDLSVCRAAAPMLAESGAVYCIESFNPLVLLWYRRHMPRVMRGQLSDGFIHMPGYNRGLNGVFMAMLQFLAADFLTAPDFIAYNCRYYRNLSRRIVRALYKNPAAAWTIKSRGQLQDMRRYFDIFIFDSFVPDKNTLT